MLSREWIFTILDDVSGILHPVRSFRHLRTCCRGFADQARGTKDIYACDLSWKSGIGVYSILEGVLTGSYCGMQGRLTLLLGPPGAGWPPDPLRRSTRADSCFALLEVLDSYRSVTSIRSVYIISRSPHGGSGA